jgi:hypothetical protein
MIVPTAEEFIVIYNSKPQKDSLMVAFTKLHLEAQKVAIVQNVTTINEPHWSGEQEDDIIVDKDSILNAYPLENVK